MISKSQIIVLHFFYRHGNRLVDVIEREVVSSICMKWTIQKCDSVQSNIQQLLLVILLIVVEDVIEYICSL